jgi:hypothetical protein
MIRTKTSESAHYRIISVSAPPPRRSHQITEQKMANIALQLTASDYSKWRPVFDKYTSVRQDKAGITSTTVYRNADDPNQVLVWWEAPDASKVVQFLQGEARGYMKEARVVGSPKIHVLP